MDTLWQGKLASIFEGYRGGRVYTLDDGSRWRQECNTMEHSHRREMAKARLVQYRSTGLRYLDVDGTSAVVRVEEEMGLRSWGMGCY